MSKLEILAALEEFRRSISASIEQLTVELRHPSSGFPLHTPPSPSMFHSPEAAPPEATEAAPPEALPLPATPTSPLQLQTAPSAADDPLAANYGEIPLVADDSPAVGKKIQFGVVRRSGLNNHCSPAVRLIAKKVKHKESLAQAMASFPSFPVEFLFAGQRVWLCGEPPPFEVAEPYPITWCAVEYLEATGSILQMLLQCISPGTPHLGRTLLHHAILCDNDEAVKVVVKCNAGIETSLTTAQPPQFRPIHMATRLGFSAILRTLIDSGSDLNSTTESGETALMISVRYKQGECLQVLAKAGADFSLVNLAGRSAASIARSSRWYLGFQQALLNVILSGTMLTSTNKSVLSPLLFVAESGDVLSLKAVIGQANVEVDEQDSRGFSAIMVAAVEGHVDAFSLLVYAGADVKQCNKSGETAITLSKCSKNSDLFERVMLEFALEKGNRIAGGFYALQYAARRGDADAVKRLISKGYDINAADGKGYTPLMLAAREGNGPISSLQALCPQGSVHRNFKSPP